MNSLNYYQILHNLNIIFKEPNPIILNTVKYKNPMHKIQPIVHSLIEGNMLYTSNLMQSLQLLGVEKITLSHNEQDANAFTLQVLPLKDMIQN